MSVLTAEQAGLVEDLLPDVDSRARQRVAEHVGSYAVTSDVQLELVPEDSSPQTLLDALKLADADTGADAIVDANIGSEVGERLFNYGHHMRHTLNVDDEDKFSQSGISLSQVSVNTLEHVILNDVMHYRTTAELGNSYVFDTLRKLGVFETHIVVVASHTPTDQATKKEYSFFDTDSVSLQAIYRERTDYVLDAAFVAGKTESGAPRHDLEAVSQAAAKFGVVVGDADTETMLTKIMVIPKDRLPNGLATFVEAYDNAIDPKGSTFYGVTEQRQDYALYQEECLARDFSEITRNVKEKLLHEVNYMNSPIEAIERLDYWSRRYSIRQAIVDDDIDEAVFGDVSAIYIRQARIHAQACNFPEMERSLQQAVTNDRSSSCPFRGGKDERDQQPDQFGEKSVREDGVMEDCEFISKKCPKCGKRNVKTTCKEGKFYGKCGCVSD